MRKKSILYFTLLLSICFLQVPRPQNWEFVGLDSMNILGLEVNGDTMWASTRDISINGKSGLYKSTNQGQTWLKLDSLLGNGIVLTFSVDENNSSDLFLIKGLSNYSNAGYFYNTTNNGTSWDSIGTPGNAPIKDFLVSPLYSKEYYSIINTIGHEWTTVQLFYRSTDGGNYWEYECCPGDQESGMYMDFAIDKINPNILYISGASDGTFFMRSTDRGNTWQNLSGEGGYKVFSDAFLFNRIYLLQYQSKIYSNDGGISWQNMPGEYSSNAIFISFYQDESTSVIYSLMNEGLFYSDNESIYLKLIPGSENLPVIQPINYSSTIRNISTDNENNFIFVGTASGIYRTDFVTGIDEQVNKLIPKGFYLEQNYPNPFNPFTTIEYSVPKTSKISLKVYDVLGSEVITLVDEEKQSGVYEVGLDGSFLSSGIYFYTLISDNFSDTKKLILLK